MKRPIIYLIAAVILALVVIAIEKPQNPRVGVAPEDLFAPDFDIAKVSRVEIEQLLDGVEIKRDGNKWIVSEFVTPLKKEFLENEKREIPEKEFHPADASRVTSALGVFGGLENGVIVSDNPEKQNVYHVDNTGVRVRIFGEGDKPILDCVIGKNGPDFMSSYIRRFDGNEVRLVRRPLTGFFSVSAQDWVEKKTSPESTSEQELQK